MSFAFKPTITTIPIISSEQEFPVRRVYCVGRNYADHAKEMGHSEREAPFFFMKPADAIVVNPETMCYPSMTKQLHHEIELVIAIRDSDAIHGFEVSTEQAWELVYGYALGVDLTKRDLQAEYKKQSRPWDLAKGFDQSAPISSIIPFEELGKLTDGNIELSVNNEIRQKGHINQMIWSIPEIISELSKHIVLKAGDLIFTGTPSGVDEIKKGQTIFANSFDLNLNFKIT